MIFLWSWFEVFGIMVGMCVINSLGTKCRGVKDEFQWEGITVRRGVWGMFILGNPGYILTTRPFELILRCE